jgi:hypothetical protein
MERAAGQTNLRVMALWMQTPAEYLKNSSRLQNRAVYNASDRQLKRVGEQRDQ